MKKIFGGLLLIFALCLAFSGCNRAQKEAPPGADPQAPVETVYAVNTYIARPENLDAYLEFGGDVEAASSVDILPDTNGKLIQLAVRVGDFVTRNQIVAQVDPSRPGLTYETSPVRAPISGTVTALPFPIGSTVAPSVAIGKISTADELEITINVAERFVSRIRLDQTALLVFDAYPSETFTARVTELSPVLNTTSRTMTVKLRLITLDPRVKIGMYARVKLITDEKRDVIAIPNDALVRRGGDTFVFAVNRSGNTVTMVSVAEGIRVDDLVEILSGVSANDEIVVKGQTLLDSGSRVNVISIVNEGATK